MSGGSLNYLFNADVHNIYSKISEIEEVEEILLQMGYIDIAKDVRLLIDYLNTSEHIICCLFDQLKDVFHDVEWYNSADIGEKDLIETLDRYRES